VALVDDAFFHERGDLGDGVFGNFVELSASAAACHAVITPENCVVELERVIVEARRDNRPAHIALPSDYALSPVVLADVKPVRLMSAFKGKADFG